MEPRQSTPTDAAQEPTWGAPPPADEDLYAGAGDGAGDWSARYGTPPPRPPPHGPVPDLSALFIVLDGLRRAAPAELQGRVTSLIRESLLTLRSLIDWYLERLDGRPPEPEVEHIPID